MRNLMNDTISKHFDNGLSIKGSYKHSIRGCYIDIFLMSRDGFILASKTLTVVGALYDAQGVLKSGIAKIEAVIKQYKVDQITDEANLMAAAPLVIQKAFPKAA